MYANEASRFSHFIAAVTLFYPPRVLAKADQVLIILHLLFGGKQALIVLEAEDSANSMVTRVSWKVIYRALFFLFILFFFVVLACHLPVRDGFD